MSYKKSTCGVVGGVSGVSCVRSGSRSSRSNKNDISFFSALCFLQIYNATSFILILCLFIDVAQIQ